MNAIWNAVGGFAILLAIFLPLEILFPAHPRERGAKRRLRAEYGTDLLFAFGQFLLWTAPVVFVLTLVYRHSSQLPLAGVRAFVGAQPFWLQFLGVILLCDVGIYWGHRLSHKFEFLWRFHRVHHTAKTVDWVAAYREHPFDNLYTRLIENLPAILLGFPLEALAGFAMFRGLWALYIHSNVSLSPGPLRYLLGSPRLHHWHHEVGHSGKVNFANLSPLMDLAFGTYYDPGQMPERYGIPDDVSTNYVVQLVDPLLPEPARSRLQERLRAGRDRHGSLDQVEVAAELAAPTAGFE
ncbi:MAG: sterol desaturase family protein [Planctomycetota bacterium]|nr:sterol desaturase family protein [Planctomycetota bacterium]